MRAPDKTAPRSRYKYRNPLNYTFIRKFKERYPKYKDLDPEILMNAIKTHNMIMAQRVVNVRDGIELPSNLGYVFIGMFKPSKKRENIDWSTSVKLGMKVMHRNWETDNRMGKIYYCNYEQRTRFKQRELWVFSSCRPFSRAASKAILADYRKFISMDSHRYIWKIFNAHNNAGKKNRVNNRELDYYDEFELGGDNQ